MAMIQSRMEITESRQRYTVVLDQCRDMAVIFCNSQLAELFEHVGTAFLDFAERAQTNTMQSGFFEAMGLIQRRRPDMEQIFRREIDQGFEFVDRKPVRGADKGTGGEDGGVELSLVGQDEMEESVAAENLIAKANENFFSELYALGERLAVINNGQRLKDTEIPAGPYHLVQAFRRSMDGLQIEVKIKIILYALFEKFVVQEAKSLYDELNGNLKDAGILPDLKPVGFKGARGQSEPQAKERAPSDEDAADVLGDGQGPSSLGEQLFESIIDLMSKGQRPGLGTPSRAGTRTTPLGRAEAAAASRELVAAVSRIQAESPFDSGSVLGTGPIPNLEIDTTFVDRVKETLRRERTQVLSQVDREKMSPMDMDLIDLIGMLFEYMLNDPVLPNLAKALLSHLHTPYLKVALIDRRLLVDVEHPARRLLDQMVEAGSLWVDENSPQQGIYPAMQRMVDRVIQEFNEDVSLFEDLLSVFEQAMQEQQNKTDTMEQRIQDAARGRERLQLAKGRGKKEIQKLLERSPVPEPVVSFLNKTWLDRLVHVLMHEEDEVRAQVWKQAVKTAEDLIALFEPKVGGVPVPPRASVLADLRERIVAGTQSMGGTTPSSLENLFKFLQSPDTWRKLRVRSVERPQPAPVEKPQRSPKPDDAEAAEAAMTEQEREVTNRLRKMKPGTWFEFASATGGGKRRIKLSWLSPLTATCMFVDRSGMQAEIKTLQELAHEILSGRAKVIPRPKHPFIERALVSIRNILQTEEGSPGGEAPQGK